MRIRFLCWDMEPWSLSAGLSITTTSWSEAKLSLPWASWPQTVGLTAYSATETWHWFLIITFAGCTEFPDHFAWQKAYFLNTSEFSFTLCNNMNGWPHFESLVFFFLLMFCLKGDISSALKKLNVIPSIIDKLSVEGEYIFFSKLTLFVGTQAVKVK